MVVKKREWTHPSSMGQETKQEETGPLTLVREFCFYLKFKRKPLSTLSLREV